MKIIVSILMVLMAVNAPAQSLKPVAEVTLSIKVKKFGLVTQTQEIVLLNFKTITTDQAKKYLDQNGLRLLTLDEAVVLNESLLMLGNKNFVIESLPKKTDVESALVRYDMYEDEAAYRQSGEKPIKIVSRQNSGKWNINDWFIAVKD